MKPNFVAVAVKNSGVALEDILPELLKSAPKLDYYLHVCLLFRRIAAGSLLSGGDPRPFHHNLFKSSRAFLHFLTRAPESQKLTSKSEPFFDAVACRDGEGAEGIARKSRPDFRTGEEYEEDFWYARFLMDLYLKEPQAGLARMLDDWKALVGGAEDLRLAVCRALLDKDQKAFDQALDAVIDSIQGDSAKKRKEETLHPDHAATAAHVSTEILALLELAERAGLKVRGAYPLAPVLARKFGRAPFPPPDAWMTPEEYRDLPPDPPGYEEEEPPAPPAKRNRP